jgi:hypothetical protein
VNPKEIAAKSSSLQTGVFATLCATASPDAAARLDSNSALLSSFASGETISYARQSGRAEADGCSVRRSALVHVSWFNEANFDLPIQLPARLTTLQRACLAATFETDRAVCPSGSLIGHVVVHTEVLPVPLTGRVYFVSYGGAKFPEAVMVLEGLRRHRRASRRNLHRQERCHRSDVP